MTAEKLNIYLIEAGPRIFPALPERITSSARRELCKLGVNVMQNTRIGAATSEGFVTADGDIIEANLMVECVEKNLIHALNGEPRVAYTYVDHG